MTQEKQAITIDREAFNRCVGEMFQELGLVHAFELMYPGDDHLADEVSANEHESSD